MSGPYFETWTHENLVKFCKEAYEKLQRQEEELQRLRLLARREWVGLTGEELDLIARTAADLYDAALKTEAKLREKNS